MPFAIVGFLIGIILGAYRAKSRNGKTADLVQWALVHGLLFAIIGLLLAITVFRIFS